MIKTGLFVLLQSLLCKDCCARVPFESNTVRWWLAQHLRSLLGTDYLRTTVHIIVKKYDDGNRWADATDGAFTPKYGML